MRTWDRAAWRVRLFSAALAACWLLAAGAGRADDWPTFRRDNYRSAATPEKLALPLKEVWKRTPATPPQPAWEGPARRDAFHGLSQLPPMRNFDSAPFVTAVGDRVTFGSAADDTVYCLDAGTGKEVWSFTTDGPVRLPPTWFDGKVCFGSDDGNVYCLRADTGGKVWSYKAGADRTIASNRRVISAWPCRTGVLVQGGRAYFGASLMAWEPSYLCAVDAATGRDKGPGLYKVTIQESTLQGALLATNDRLIVMQGPIVPLAVALADGRVVGTLQRSKRFGGVYAVMSPDAKVAYGYGPTGGTMYLYDTKTGQLSELRHTTQILLTPQLNVFYQRGAFSVRDVPRENALAAKIGQLEAQKKMAEAAEVRKEFFAAGWKFNAPEPLALAMAGGVLLAGYDGEVAAYDVRNGTVLWNAKVSGPAYGLAVANGRLFVSTGDGTIHCFAAR